MNSLGKIGVIMPEIVDPLDYEMISGIKTQASELGYDVIIYTGIFNSQSELQQDYYTEGLENIYSLISKSSLDGIIFVAERFHNVQLVDKIYGYLSQTDVPCLTLGYKREGFPYITAKQYEGIYNITKHLINDHGCRKLCCLAGVPDHEPSQKRLQGFIDAVNEYGLELNENSIRYGWYWKQVPIEFAMDIISGKVEKPDAVVCLNDTMAYFFQKTLIENGMSVPEDIAITGCDGSWYSIMNAPQITTVVGRDYRLGIDAVCCLYKMITGNNCQHNGYRQHIIYGKSCGCSYEKMAEKNGMLFVMEKNVRNLMLRTYDKKAFIATDIINRMAGADSIDELMSQADKTGHILRNWKWIDICLCQDWKMDFDNPDKFRQTGFSDKMLLALSKRYGQNDEHGYMFPVSQIIPSLNKPHEPCVITLTSLHCKGQIFGYCAVAYDSTDNIDLDQQYINWCDAVSNGLSALQKQLYIASVHQQMDAFSTIDPVTGMLNKRGFTELLPDTLHKLRKQEKYYSILFVSYVSDTDDSAYDMSVITANALKKNCDDKLCGRLTNDVFAVILWADSKDALDEYAVDFTSVTENNICEIFGKPLRDTKMFTYLTEISGSKPSEVEKSFEKALSLFAEKKSAETSHYVTYKEQLFRLRREIISQPEKEWTIPDISKQLGISRSHLLRLYRNLFSTSIKDDIISSRIDKAKQLLDHTELRVQEIAEQCGYNNENHFMRQFKEKIGVTALQYRKNNS
ncbi:MAG: substrate-binding domain-containing protein [Ruminococcus sp.]|nr:substrate-binding domain-containing protein [Ruminococcus sp.]